MSIEKQLKNHPYILRSRIPLSTNVLFALLSIIIIAMAYSLIAISLGLIFGMVIVICFVYSFATNKLCRTYVYDDRIEVKHLLRPQHNYEIAIKEIDAYCIEERWEREGKTKIKVKYIYFLIGHQLQLFVSSHFCSNLDEMLDVLGYFGIPKRNGTVSTSFLENIDLIDGQFVELDDISDEELNQLAEQRKKRRLSTKEPPKYNDGFEIASWKNFLLLAGFIGVIFGVIKTHTYIKEKR